MNNQTGTEEDSRIYYFDYLRLFVIVLVVFLHALLPHVEGFVWYVNDSQTSGVFTLLSLVIDIFIMPTVFFIAGYFAYSSLKKRGVKLFIYNKFRRIGVPAIIGVLCFVPIIRYVSTVASSGADIGFIQYWTQLYFSDGLELAHYWFLAMLFVFFCAFALVYRLRPDPFDTLAEQQNGSVTKRGVAVAIGSVVALGIGLFFAVSLFSPDGRWVYLFDVLNFQPTRTTGYALYFALGIGASLSGIELSQNAIEKLPYVGAGTVGLTAGYLAFKVTFISELAGSVPLKFANATLHVVLCFAIFVSLLLAFKKYLSYSSKPLNRLARTSYSIYFFHLPITVMLQYYLLPTQLSPYGKFAIVFGISLSVSYVLSELYLYGFSFAKRSLRRRFGSPASRPGQRESLIEE